MVMNIPSILADAGCEKLTFEGGEPFLCPFLEAIVKEAHACGMVTSIISNGSLITYSRLQELASCLDWLGLSIDSSNELVEKKLGRGFGNHVSHCMEVATWCRELNIRLKVNTVVTTRNFSEEMVDFILTLRPERWKVFQVLMIQEENDFKARHLQITANQFDFFIEQNRKIEQYGIPLVAETNSDMIGSYIMLLPDGRFFSNHRYRYIFGTKSIFEYGVQEALAEVGWDKKKFYRRGGIYNWNRPTSNIVVEEVRT